MLNLSRHTVSTRWLAGMLTPLLLWCSTATAIDPAAAARLANCLQAWGITWKHPYFPSFERGYCPAESAQSAGEAAMFSGLPNRRQKVSLAYRTDWFAGLAPGASAGSLRDEGARLAFVHVEQLLLAQQFARLAGPVEAAAKPAQDTSTAASYEKTLPGGIHRVDVHTRLDSVELVFEQRGALRTELALPAPTDGFDITAPGINAGLFAMPGLKLTGEMAVLENVLVSALPAVPAAPAVVAAPAAPSTPSLSTPRTSTAPEPGRVRNPTLVWAPARRFTYQHERKVSLSEFDAALRELLLKTGWKPVTDSVLTRGNGYRYTLPTRQLEIGIRIYSEQEPGQPVAVITMADPSFWETVLPLLDQGGGFDKWEIAPVFDANGQALTATQHQMFVYATRANRIDSPGERMLVVPVLAPALQRDPAAVNHARTSARWVRDQLVRHRFAAGQIRLMEELRAPSLPAFKVTSGAHVSWYNCNTKSQSRPDGTTQTCECRADFGVVSSSPGACK